ncbi:MAG TPA: aminotransferase class I/II-fold pyridoxal phosphate-dependent enzyme [Archangium sp.]|uniref:aminotransferase class I/II-fold pyridoxal phosphate-dependent enzyme n=1 Tax=Archangium sp. TaxID=1872627 RepID=UPI002E35DE90|nr:aminotransferase class I/II-fold pyridoxal phosphate-dependent enzyme [Archangium sp.]HEX5751325.1 aminotransferase class I/II-fold pyridoxal phosphate-dependent enzyme [Archangium sp.]
MSMSKPQRLQKLAAAVFTAVDEARKRKLATGADVINLSIGSPDLPPAPHITEALAQGIRDPSNYGYPMRDLPVFREAVAGWYQRRFGVTLRPDSEVLGLTGSQEGLAHITQAVTDPGDLVLVPDPGYPIYTAGPVLAGAELHPVPLKAEHGYLPDLEALPEGIKRRARLLILNYPSNPLAAVVRPGFFEQVVAFARRYGTVILHDAAYSELSFDGYRPPGFLETPGAMEVGLEFNSLSKTFNLAGARIAYAVGNARLLGQLAEVKTHLDCGLFRPIQAAAIAALTGPQQCVADMAATYQRRRDVLVDGLNRLGWAVPKPKATMFCWAPVPPGFESSLAFAMALLEQVGVTVVPGSGFGAMGEGYVRIAFVQSEARLAEAVERIARSGILDRRAA